MLAVHARSLVRSVVSRSDPRSPLLLLALLAACGAGSGGRPPAGGLSEVGTWMDAPDGRRFRVDANRRGAGNELGIARVAWGRLVDVYGLDASGRRVLRLRDFVIGQDVASNGVDYQLTSNPVTGREELVVLRSLDEEQGRLELEQLLDSAEASLTPVPIAGLGVTLPTVVPRNATIVVQFDDLLDPATVTPSTLRTLVGAPPEQPFEVRLVLDPNHGDLADHDGVPGLELYATRVLVDATISERESFDLDPPQPVNPVGLPPAVDVNQPNLLLRLPTETHAAYGQSQVLANLTGHRLAKSGPWDASSPTGDLLVAMRSGGPGVLTADPYNGFLRDDEPPRVRVELGMQLPLAPEPLPAGPDEHLRFALPVALFDSEPCSLRPLVGELIATDVVVARVLAAPQPPVGGAIEGVVVTLLDWPASWDGPEEWVDHGVGAARLVAAYDPGRHGGREACLLALSNTAPNPDSPGERVSTGVRVGLGFSEPMDPASIDPYDNFRLLRSDPAQSLGTGDYVVGEVRVDASRTGFRHDPDLPLAHVLFESESYWLDLQDGVQDLAGNALVDLPPAIELTIDPLEPTQRNGGRVLRFHAVSEEDTGSLDGPEVAGQHLWQLDRGIIAPRPVTRFTAWADRSQSLINRMTPFGPGVQTPLSSLGSKLHAIWRHVDVGLSLTDPGSYNVDIEGLSWAPRFSPVLVDQYENFEIRLAHCGWAPDEILDGFNLPKYRHSGLVKPFEQNYLDIDRDGGAVVHDRALGYQVHSGATFTSPNGTPMVPYPLNRTVPPSQYEYYTWRDTALRARGGKESGGVDPESFYAALGQPHPSVPYYTGAEVRTIGLPLLMEFRCFPDDGATGLNAFDVSLASNSSSRPYFRAFSTGGIQGTKPVPRNPDLESKANGGFNPTTGGTKTWGVDPTVYLGALDLVVRVSRSHSVWFPAELPGPGGAPVFSPPLLVPDAADQPHGTSVSVAVRGATVVDNAQALADATKIDAYGDHYDEASGPIPHDAAVANVGITFVGGSDEWHADVSAIDGAHYYQLRLTFESNPLSGLTPTLSALALAWKD